MTKKQFIWFCLAALIFVGAGFAAVRGAARVKEQSVSTAVQLKDTVEQLTGASADELGGFPEEPFIARLSVDGTITSSVSPATFYESTGFDLDYLSDYIDRLIACESNAALYLYINSPGGEMNASDKLYCKLMDYKKLTGRPIYCFFDDLACSGGYYVAMPADEIWADRNCMCVNIGVYIATYNVAGLFEKLGVEQIVFRSSDNKGIGMEGVPWTDEQKEIYQSIVDENYEQFLDVVAEGRGMTVDKVRALDDGREMTAKQALKAGFIDGICRQVEYEQHIEEECGAYIYEESRESSFWEELGGYFGAFSKKTELDELRELAKLGSSTVVMAYAH